MNITLVISSLSSGGAERVMSIMANYWADRAINITLITLDSKENDFYVLDTRISRIGLDLMHNSATRWEAIKNNYTRFKQLRKALKQSRANVVISFIDNMNVMTLLAVIGLRMNVVISERNDPRQYSIGFIWDRLRLWVYPKADAIVVQTLPVKKWAEGKALNQKIDIIPNPVLPVSLEKVTKIPYGFNQPFVVAMGRLVPQKGFDLLIKAFARIRDDDWSLVIIGEGPERFNLDVLIKQLNLENRVYLPGRITEPNNILQQAELFVLSSHYEGFPNALLESMSCGLAVISFDCPSGPSDIIKNGENGILVPPMDIESLSAAMNNLIRDEGLRKKLGARARNVAEEFSVNKIMLLWDRLFDEAIK